MIHIKKFIDKVSLIESKQGKDVVMPISDARGLRDELAKILVDNFQIASNKKNEVEPTIKIELKGGSFR
jgi:hypothetical protein